MISLIIPTYNEAENITQLISTIDRALTSPKVRDYELLVVDDDSPDKTWALAEKMAKNYPVTVIRRIKERGLATAVVEGFRRSKGDIVGVMDADLSHPPALLPELLVPIEQGRSDITVGSRLVDGGGVEDWPVHRKLVSEAARLLARPLTPVKDIMSGYFFLKRNVLGNVILRPKGYKILLEILVKGKYSSVEEIPFLFKNRSVGQSKLNFVVQLDYLKHLVQLYRFKFGFRRKQTTI